MFMGQNHLALETSPYLLQHANNPVDWYPWSEEAINKAKLADKPILLSIGYAACHWCHVMAHESFEDLETAVLMNRWFVNIKVDREERPDLDKIYQTAHHILVQQNGGWPLTVFLNPHNLVPFYSGTYFPLQARYGLPSFQQVLHTVAEYYRANQTDILEQNQQLLAMFSQLSQTAANTTTLQTDILQMAYQEIKAQYDTRHGGFGSAPKFPQPTYLRFLLHYSAMNTSAGRASLIMLQTTLTKMAQGGIYDQVGGGFYRYSVDEQWNIPHFEKMLYDNAQLLSIYAAAYSLDNLPLYDQVLQATAAWVMKDMQAAEGGYYATRDADSEGEEGKYYYWSRENLKQLLSPTEYSVAALYYGLNQPPNFELHWHLQARQSLEQVAQQLNLPAASAQASLDTAKQKLAKARMARIPPLRDEKIITAWNGLMIKGMADAGIYLQQASYIASARKAFAFIRQHLWRKGRLLATYKDGQAKYNAYLDDYAFLLEGLLSLLQAQWQSDYVQFAIKLADVLLAEFQDKQGGFFFTAHDHETLIYRPKPFFDEAIPAGNGAAALALGRLGYLTGEQRYLDAAQNTLQAASDYLQDAPHGCASLLLALQDYLSPPMLIVLRGKSPALETWQKVVQQTYRPNQLCFAIPEDAAHLPTKLTQMTNQAEVTAYICRGPQCLSPITQLAELKEFLVSNN